VKGIRTELNSFRSETHVELERRARVVEM